MKNDLPHLLRAQKEVATQSDYLMQAGWEGYRFFSNISVVSAALLVVATFNPALVAVTAFTKFLIAILLLTIPVNLWCTFIEIDTGIRETMDRITARTEEATGSDVSSLRKISLKVSVTRRIQFASLVALTLVILALIVLILK